MQLRVESGNSWVEITFPNGCIVTWNPNQQPTYAWKKDA